MLGIEELEALEENIRAEIDENLTGILTRLNREGKLDDLLQLLNIQPIEESHYLCYDNGTIIVIGESKVSETDLIGVAKSMGFNKNRFEFYLDYEDGKHFDSSRIQWNPSYSLIMVGPMPHSGEGKGNYGSVIAAMEQDEGYPPVIRLGSNGLKITKSDFRAKLQEAIDSMKIAVS